MTSFCHLPIYL